MSNPTENPTQAKTTPQTLNTLNEEDVRKMLKETREKILKRISDIENIFNMTIDELVSFKNFLGFLAIKYNSDNVKKFIQVIEQVIEYTTKVRQHWHEKVHGEVMRLIDIDQPIRGNSTITIRGKYASIIAHRRRNSIIVKILIKCIKGIRINVPPVLSEHVRNSIALGLLRTDGYIDKYGKPVMGTVYLWQIALWFLGFPGENYIGIKAIDVNDKDAKLVWSLRNYRRFQEPQLLDELIIYFAGLMGDGYIYLRKKDGNGTRLIVGLTGKYDKMVMWKEIVKKLGVKYYENNREELDVLEIAVSSSNAIQLLRMIYNEIINEPMLIDILSFFTQYNDGEKIRRFLKTLELKIKRSGEYSVLINGWKFTVSVVVTKNGYWLHLVLTRKKEEEAKMIAKWLKDQYGVDAKLRRRGRKYGVILNTTEVRKLVKDWEIRMQLVAVLCKKYTETSDDRKRQIIRKYIMEFAPTRGVYVSCNSQF